MSVDLHLSSLSSQSSDDGVIVNAQSSNTEPEPLVPQTSQPSDQLDQTLTPGQPETTDDPVNVVQNQILQDHQTDVATAKARISGINAEVKAIKMKQEPLWTSLHALDGDRAALLEESDGVEHALKGLAEVQNDLKDLEALAMAYC
ncbi:hypothetical protein AAF712_016784 [Marasmius tenuissimus]|uniref:Uncharacterized protein n=1 Tax=Marasmius tenuissimus TaxID=585030 RepID=A0ABR2Z6Y9_9AGAR